MSESNALFQLIQALDAGEKRYFSLSVSKYAKAENNSLLLFDAMRSMKKYDEKLLRSKLKNHRILKNLAVEKHLLFERIISGLTAYHATASDTGKLRQLVDEAHLLYSKAIPEACYKKIKTAKAAALRLEELNFLIELIGLERNLVNDGFLKISLDTLYREEAWAVEALHEKQSLFLLSHALHALWKTKLIRDKNELKAIEQVAKKAKRFNPDKLLTTSAKVTYYGIMLRYTRIIGDNKQQLYFSRRSLDLLESEPERIEEKIAGYFSRLINVIIGYGENREFDKMQEQLDKLKTLPLLYQRANTPQMRLDIRSTYFGLQLEAFTVTGNSEAGVLLIPELELWLKNDGKNLDRNHYMIICLAAANIFFIHGEYRKTLYWIRLILNEQDVGHRDEIQCFGRIIQLIAHYKMNSTDLLPSLLRNTYRFLHQRKNLFALEQELLRFIALRLRPDAHVLNLKAAMIKLHRALTEIVRDPVENKVLDYFDMISWLESEISGKTFGLIKREKALPAG